MDFEEEFVIQPPKKLTLNFRELWQYRELFYFFTWRDVKVKYKQTALGIIWAILQPVFLVIIFTVFFSRALKLDTSGVPYPLFVFSGLILWTVFSNGISNAGNSMVVNANIIRKIYFPRLIIPISSVLSSMVDFCFALIVFIGLLIWYQPAIEPTAFIYWPLAVMLTCTATFGLGCWLAALNIKYRDFRYVIPFLVQIMLFLTPVIYPVSMFSQNWLSAALALNPMYSAIEIFRAPLSGGISEPWLVGISIVSVFLVLIIGLFYFKKTEMYFADLA